MDVAVLGSQKLTALRDVIKCEADANMQAKGLQQPSAFFYIEVCQAALLAGQLLAAA